MYKRPGNIQHLVKGNDKKYVMPENSLVQGLQYLKAFDINCTNYNVLNTINEHI